MIFDIKPEKQNAFKKYMAKKLSEETGETYLPKDIYVSKDFSRNVFYMTKNNHYKCIFGHVSFKNYDSDVLSDVEFIWGNADFRDSKIKKFEKLKFVEGLISMKDSVVYSFNNLEYAGGIELYNCKIKNFGSLKTIKRDLFLSQSEADNLGALVLIGGSFYLWESDVISLNKLEKVEGNLYFQGDGSIYGYSHIYDLGKLNYVGGRIEISPNLLGLFEGKIFKQNGNVYFINNSKTESDYDDLDLY